MVPALFVANYIIEYSNERNYEINNLKLQKLLYFINARCLLENDVPIFEESFEKWKFGPVVPQVYHEYKGFGAFNIPKSDIVREKHTIDFGRNPFENNKLKISTEYYDSNDIQHKELIQSTVDSLKDFTPFELVENTHEQNIWKKDEERIRNGEKGIKYSNKEIKDFFGIHKEYQLWNEG